MTNNGPSPQQQADYLVRKLEQTIRDNRTVKGMSFRTWQAIAKEEIANALAAAEKRHVKESQTINRLILVVASSLVSIGFWGAVVAVDRAYGAIAAMVSLAAGLALFFVLADFGLKKLGSSWDKSRREERLANIESLDRRIKRMEDALKKKHDQLKERLEETGPL